MGHSFTGFLQNLKYIDMKWKWEAPCQIGLVSTTGGSIAKGQVWITLYMNELLMCLHELAETQPEKYTTCA